MNLLDGFRWTREPWGTALRSAPLAEAADHFFTTRQLWLRGDSEDADWASVAATIGVPPDRLLRLHQVHGRDVVVARRGDEVAGRGGADAGVTGGAVVGHGGRRWPEADILVSNDPSVALAIQVADCVPLLMADRRTGAVAGVHAGWRGTAAGAARAAVDALCREFGSRPGDLVVAQGPSIGACCYEVGTELVDAFDAGGFGRSVENWFARDADGRLRLDLWAANRDQLIESGVRAEDIHQSGLCTASQPEWFASYRRDGPKTGRIAAVVRSRPR
jgi:polyphenol oxidase